jgi:hypothetical protein
MDFASIVTSVMHVLVISHLVPTLWRSDQSTVLDFIPIVSYNIEVLVLSGRGKTLEFVIPQPRAV